MRLRLLLAATAALVSTASAQGFGRNGGGQQIQTPFTQNVKYDGRFTFARLSYNTMSSPYYGYYYGGRPAWAHGYNLAERNLTQILNSLSTMGPRLEATVVLNLDDPELFKYPLSFMTEAGYWTMSDKEALAFRKYLQKGGFVIFDDFRSDNRDPEGYENFKANMERILPKVKIFDLTPKDPIFHSFFEINSFNVIPQAYGSGRPILQAIYEDNDPTKRMVAMINYNTDVSQYWEFSSTGFRPMNESNEAYKMGVNYLIYAMSH
jgi:Domain of unknown function (DUF4159)